MTSPNAMTSHSAPQRAVVGVDIGTSSSKGVLVSPDGTVLAQSVVRHSVDRPHPGWVEMDPEVWWREFTTLVRDLLGSADVTVEAVGVSGMGPCVAVTDETGEPLRPALLYGIDTRATEQIGELEAELGREEILRRCGSVLSTQAVGPKLAWLARHEPGVFARARRLFMPSSWLVHRLTGEYVLDHHSASQCTPLYDTGALDWYRPWSDGLAGRIELPRLAWSGDVAGRVSPRAAEATGLTAGTPVTVGTIDAWAEAISGDAHNAGDLMLMYGSTMFLINTVEERVTFPALWGTVGALPGTRNLAGGMASSGAITDWLRSLFGDPSVPELLAEAETSGPGARGLLMLPYFDGERTPVADPAARGVLAGLTLAHTRGDLYRAALEATGFGVRHNVEAIRAAGGRIDRVVAVGGGAQGHLWTQIVSDITGLTQDVPTHTIGASLGSAFLAASAVGDASIARWNPPAVQVRPDPATTARYDELYARYRELYPATADIVHGLATG